MRLSIVRGGGIAGTLTSRAEISTESLAPADAEALRAKVHESGVLELADDVARTQHPEDLMYELTVEDEGEHHTVRIPESALPEHVRSLIAWTDGHPETRHAVGPSGAA